LVIIIIYDACFGIIIGMPFIQFNQEKMNLNILSKLLILFLNLLYQNQNKSVDWKEFIINLTFSVKIAFFEIFIASSLYKQIYSSLQYLKFFNLVAKKYPKRIL